MAEKAPLPGPSAEEKPEEEQAVPHKSKQVKCFVPSCIMNNHQYPWRRFARLPRSLKNVYCEGLEIVTENRMYVCDRHYATDDIDWAYSAEGPNSIPRLKEGVYLKACPRPARNPPSAMARQQKDSSASDFSSDGNSDVGTDSDSSVNTESSMSSIKSVDSNVSKYSRGGPSRVTLPEPFVSTTPPREEEVAGGSESQSDAEVRKYFFPNADDEEDEAQKQMSIRHGLKAVTSVFRRQERRERASGLMEATRSQELGESSRSLGQREATMSQGPGKTNMSQAPGCTSTFQWPRKTAMLQGPGKTSISQAPGCTSTSQGPRETAMLQGPGKTNMSQAPGCTSTSQGPRETAMLQGPGKTNMSQGPGCTSTSQGPGETAMFQGPGATAQSSRATDEPVHSSQATTKTVKEQGKAAKPKTD